MILSNKSNLIRSSNSLDVDASAYKDRIIAAGSTISTASLAAVNTFTKSLKSTGVWNSILEIAPFAGAILAGGLVKLKYPSGVQSALTGVNMVSGDYSEATGVTGDSTNKYIRTGFVVDAQISDKNSIHVSAYVRNSSRPSFNATGGYLNPIYMGCRDSASPIALAVMQQSTSGVFCNMGDSADFLLQSSFTNPRGLWINAVTAVNNAVLYRNGASVASDTSFASRTLPAFEMVLLGFNFTGSYQCQTAGNISFYSIGNGLTSQQAADFYAAVQVLQTALGRQV